MTFRKSESWDECFIILPFKNEPEKCLVYYYTEFGTKEGQFEELQLDPEYEEFMVMKRVEVLKNLNDF